MQEQTLFLFLNISGTGTQSQSARGVADRLGSFPRGRAAGARCSPPPVWCLAAGARLPSIGPRPGTRQVTVVRHRPAWWVCTPDSPCVSCCAVSSRRPLPQRVAMPTGLLPFRLRGSRVAPSGTRPEPEGPCPCVLAESGLWFLSGTSRGGRVA